MCGLKEEKTQNRSFKYEKAVQVWLLWLSRIRPEILAHMVPEMQCKNMGHCSLLTGNRETAYTGAVCSHVGLCGKQEMNGYSNATG